MQVKTNLSKLNIKCRSFFVNNKMSFVILKKIFLNSWIFIVFSFLNVSLPIVICLLATKLNYGAYATMGIGFVTTFLLAFSQMGFSFSIFSSFYYFQNINSKKLNFNLEEIKKDLIYDIIVLGLIYGFILAILYFTSSYTYTKYANIHVNTIDSLPYAFHFTYTSVPYVFLVVVQYSLIMVINNKKNQLHALLQLFVAFFVTILLISILVFFTDLEGYGIGIGLSVGSLISIISSFIHLFFFTDTFKTNYFKINGKYLVLIIKNTWRQIAITVSIQIFKGCALLLLSYQIPDALVNSVPLDYQMSRIIWYNMMYLIPFILNGLTDSLYYFFLKEKFFYEENKEKININLVMIFILVLSIILTTLLIVACNYLSMGLSLAYTKNQNHSFSDEAIASDLYGIGKSKIIETINNSELITQEQKNWLIQLVNNASEEQIKQIIDQTILPKFVSFSNVPINNILIFPKSFTYFYLCFYCVLYGSGQLLNAFGLSVTNRKPKVALLVIAQLLAILFVVEFGINFQETQKFYLMEAWSFPLLIIGIVAFVYMSFAYFLLTYDHQKKVLMSKINVLNKDIENSNSKKQ